ncbi:membrane dipeptidase [Sphingosinicella soli]|uniref:Membrane dipeptidase n=1 Tax=Sphingosinicella soli TaxID=333708 RepID=A0A7W7B4J6_9SPHN|nr:membrane dipeptidase [Sphingosinicella soli]MBB4633881.1 membrane dipeptidase [Sphingosinicella soli]
MTSEMNRRGLMKFAGGSLVAAAAGVAAAGAATAQAAPDDGPIVVDGCSPAAPTAAYLALLRKGGVDSWNVSMLPTLLQMSQLLEFAARNAADVEIAKTAGDIRRIKREGKISLTIGWQEADLFAAKGESDWWSNPPQTTMRLFHEVGLRVCGLIYNLTNAFAGGCLDPHVGLTKAGRVVVAQMQQLGILVDVGGHMGEQSSLDVIAMAQRPVVCTHSNVAALNSNPRNTSDRVIEGIAKTGGLFGVSAIDPFMSWSRDDAGKRLQPKTRADVKRYVDELDYLKRLVGVDHIGVGADFTTGANAVIRPEESFAFPPEMTYVQDPIQYAAGFEDISKLPAVRAEMERRGWRKDEIDKVMGENWMRVYAASIGA